MPRIARVALEDVPFHITQRGNACQQVFDRPEDYELYLDLLYTHTTNAQLEILAYCLMPNHVHLVAIPRRPNAMAAALGRTHANYARYLNLTRRTCGHIWQARFFSCPLDEPHLWNAIAYVERNPSRAGLVTRPEQYLWSTARQRLSLTTSASARRHPELLHLALWQTRYAPHEWLRALETSIAEEAFGRRLQEASRSGRPLGGRDFTSTLEIRTGRALEPRPAGRPKLRKHAAA